MKILRRVSQMPCKLLLLTRTYLLLTFPRNLYSIARSEALRKLYMSKELGKDRSEKVEADFEEVAASCGHFSFSLYDFGTEMQTFLQILEELKHHTETEKTRSWKWLAFWKRGSSTKLCAKDPELQPLLHHTRHVTSATDIPGLTRERLDTRYWSTTRKDKDSIKQRLSHTLLRVFSVMRRDDGKLLDNHRITLLTY